MKKLSACILGCCLLIAPLSTWADELINCVEANGFIPGDGLSRGFGINSFPGFTLDKVYLFFDVAEPGEGVYQLTATSGGFDGEVIAAAEASYTFSGNREPVPIVFDFQNATVVNGQPVAFAITQESGSQTFYKVGNFTVSSPPEGCPIVQTSTTSGTGGATRRFGIHAIITGATEELTASMALLENPGDGADGSGITSISGWVCDAERVEIEIDETILVEAAYGTPRADTMDVCGDSDNGFGILVNFGILDDGPHDIRLLADGIEVDSATFNVTTLGSPFVSGLSGTFDLLDFPEGGDQVTVEWVQSLQGFVITDFTPSP